MENNLPKSLKFVQHSKAVVTKHIYLKLENVGGTKTIECNSSKVSENWSPY
jgi:hypothetical protein